MRTTENKLRTPKGTKDLFDSELFVQEKVEALIFQVARGFGFQRIETPVFEHLEVFDSTSRINREKCYILKDKAERELVLRPDINAPISRALVSNLSSVPIPAKLFFCGNVYRYRHHISREFKMLGIESYGIPGLEAEIEILLLLKEILERLGIKDYMIEFGNLKIYNDYLKGLIKSYQLVIDEEDILHQLSLSDNKQKTIEILSFLPKDEIDFFCRLMYETGTLLEFVSLLNLSPWKSFVEKQLQVLIEFDNLLGENGFFNRRFNFSNLHGIGFYSGLTYRIYSEVIKKNIADGGRYDSFVKDLGGIQIPATGLGISLSRLITLIPTNGLIRFDKPKSFLFCVNNTLTPELYGLLNSLRSDGLIIEVETIKRKFKQRLNYLKLKSYSGLINLISFNDLSKISFDLFNSNGEFVLQKEGITLTDFKACLTNF